MTVDWHAAGRNNARGLLPKGPSFLHWITSYKTIAQYPNQKTDINTIHTLCSDFTNFTWIHLCVYLVSCTCITCVDLCEHHHSQGTEQFPMINWEFLFNSLMYSNSLAYSKYSINIYLINKSNYLIQKNFCKNIITIRFPNNLIIWNHSGWFFVVCCFFPLKIYFKYDSFRTHLRWPFVTIVLVIMTWMLAIWFNVNPKSNVAEELRKIT